MTRPISSPDSSPASLARSIIAGALAGAVATLVMSPAMAPRLTRATARRLPHVDPLDEFPPRRIIGVLEQHATGHRPLPAAAETAVTWAAHLGYGTTMGALYGAVTSPRRPHSPAAAGALFGMGVWAAGYVGWLPLIGVEEGTVRGRPADMPFPLAAHVLYGIAAGVLHDRLR